MRCHALRIGDECAQIGPRSRAFNEQMEMIWHEAVRKKVELVSACGFHKLQADDIDKTFVREAFPPRKRA